MRFLRFAAITILALVLVVFIGVGFGVGWPVFFGPETRPVTDRTFDPTPERLARGRYLVDAVSACMKCHTPPDLNRHGAPPVEGSYAAGMTQRGPGVVTAPNLTSDPETGIGSWTDDELARAIREGVSRDGRALFPMMPYHKYRVMSDEDLASVIVYLRSLEPIRNPLPKTEIIFPVRHLINTIPASITSPVVPDISSQVALGKHLVTLAACEDCHTTYDSQRAPIAGLEFAGGNVMEENEGTAATANITQDPSGIGAYTPERFREVMRTGRDGDLELHPLMPYYNYSNLSDTDLDAMFAYLKTVKPVEHWVSNAGQPILCALCNNEHPMGERNTAR